MKTANKLRDPIGGRVACAPLLAMLIGSGWAVGDLRAEEAKQVAYEPAVVTLTGSVIEVGYGEDASPIDRGKKAWILRLDRPISVPGKPGDEIDTEEKDVQEIHLNLAELKGPRPNLALRKARISVTGTLYHSHTIHHLRPIVMMVSALKAAPVRP